MAYNGFEIAMLSLGRADCLLVSRWVEGNPTRVLIDGGRKGHAKTIKVFLQAHGSTSIDHVICTHHDDDHAGGLVELIKDDDIQFGKAWVHVPEQHVNRGEAEIALSQAAGSKKAQVAMKSLQTSDALLAAIEECSLPLEEPFSGKRVGFLTICGPTEEFYEELVGDFKDADKMKTSDLSELLHEAVLKSASKDGLLDSPPARPENDGSVILATAYDDEIYLFTGDAGPRALERAKDSFQIAGCSWMQLPHHGSRNNVTARLVEDFSPQTAYVSAPGNDDHPHRAVVDAFKEAGAGVYSTHYPHEGHLFFRRGNVPDLPGLNGAATPLWDAG